MKIKSLLMILVALMSLNAQAKKPLEDHQFLKSTELKAIVDGFLATKFEATDKYEAAYYLPAFYRVKNIPNYILSVLDVGDTHLFKKVQKPEGTDKVAQLAHDLSYELMHGDPYVDNVDLTTIGHLLQPLIEAIKDPAILIYSGTGSDDEFSANHVYLVAISTITNEMIILTVGYSE